MRKIIIAGMISNGLEWYDFAIYTFTALTISKLFFPAGNENAHLLATLGIFAVGFVARPFGGVMFGILGDRMGRRTALVLSIFMMAVPTGCIGLLPTYAQIGMLAPYLLVFLRVLQGLSLGGAFAGSMTFLVEHAPPGRRGLIGSSLIASLVFGFLLGSLIAWGLTLAIGQEGYESWGWRIPFLLGIPIGFVGLYIRKYCGESPTYEAAKSSGALSKNPVRDVLKHHMKPLLAAMAIYLTVTMPFYLLTAYFTTFTEHTLHRSKSESLLLGSVNMTILLVLAPLSGWLSDRIGRRKVLGASALASLLLTYPIFTMMLAPGYASVVAAQMLFAVIVGIYISPVPALLVEMFPTRVRYTAMSLSYNICAAAFGGTAPMVCEWLIQHTGNSYSIAWYVMLCAAISLVTLVFFFEDRHDRELQ